MLSCWPGIPAAPLASGQMFAVCNPVIIIQKIPETEMIRLRRALAFGMLSVSLASAVGCAENTEPPKSFSKNMPEREQTGTEQTGTGKTTKKVTGRNQQVRGFTVPGG